MNKMSAQQARARFDELDAEGVVTFLQEPESHDDPRPFHRGYRRHTLAELIINKKPIPMTLVVDIKAQDGRYNPEALHSFAMEVMAKKEELGMDPIVYPGDEGYFLEATFKWERQSTDIEEVAAKAFIRDNPGYANKAKKSSYGGLSSGSVGAWISANSASTAAPSRIEQAFVDEQLARLQEEVQQEADRRAAQSLYDAAQRAFVARHPAPQVVAVDEVVNFNQGDNQAHE